MSDWGTPPNLQESIEEAGSPLRLLWRSGPSHWEPPRVEPEYAGWRREQHAWRDGVVIADLSFHMYDTVIEGPDARAFLEAFSANDFARFAVGQAKQFVPVTAEGLIVSDGILMKRSEHEYLLSGVPAAQTWIAYQAAQGGYDVTTSTDSDLMFRQDDPLLFRMQVQGPRAMEVVREVFGGPLPETRFFHSAEVELAGRPMRALRHNMAGQAGVELIGDYRDHDAVKERILTSGEAFDLVRIGAKSYPTMGIESGWIPGPLPAIYTDPGLADYRRTIPLYSYEGRFDLYGSYLPRSVEELYESPWELGYGRSLSFDHDFLGRDALRAARDTVTRTRRTVVLDPDDLRAKVGAEPPFIQNFSRFRIEQDGRLVGRTAHVAYLDPHRTYLALALVDTAIDPGTEVEVAWGHLADPDVPDEVVAELPRVKATVAPSPYDAYAATTYRRA